MAVECVKVTDLVKNNNSNDVFSYSLEITPEIDIEELRNIEIEPLFYSITWHAKTHRCKNLDIPPLKLAEYLKEKGKTVLLHVSCDFQTKTYLNDLLHRLIEIKLCNLFVCLGESFDPVTSDFKNSKELISHIRYKTGNYFCIGVPGFPDHVNDENFKILKDKIESGVDFIITQAFFESSVFQHYLDKCRQVDVHIPIIAGIYMFDTMQQLTSFVNICKVKVSEICLEKMKQRNDGNDFLFVGGNFVKALIQNVNDSVDEKIHYHFFTLNKLKRVQNFVNEVTNL